MLEVKNLTKKYGSKVAVDNISFTVPNGRVTGFLGPNGAGKSTTMRLITGLEHSNSGTALVDNVPYRALASPITSVGALLDGKSFHPGRTAYQHLRTLALTHSIPVSRVKEVLELAGISSVANRKVGKFSLGMTQRLGIASVLLGDPQNIILDEPVNGLDPEGVVWVRQLAHYLASEGKAVLISSHLMSEMQLTADDLIIIGRGRLLEHTSMQQLLDRVSEHRFLVRTDERERLQALLRARSIDLEPLEHDALMVQAPAEEIARLALDERILIYELSSRKATLEDVYLQLTRGEEEYSSLAPNASAAPAAPASAIPWQDSSSPNPAGKE